MTDLFSQHSYFKFNQYEIIECKFSHIKDVFLKNHYKAEHMGGGISHCFALVLNGVVCGGAVYGLPRHAIYGDDVLDLRRFALNDDCIKNSESYFLARTIKILNKKYKNLKILTFADKTQGHIGTIYKACNFKLIGETKPSKHILWNGKQYHMRSLTIDRPYSYKLRDALKNNQASLVTGLIKYKFMYDTNDKKRSSINPSQSQ